MGCFSSAMASPNSRLKGPKAHSRSGWISLPSRCWRATSTCCWTWAQAPQRRVLSTKRSTMGSGTMWISNGMGDQVLFLCFLLLLVKLMIFFFSIYVPGVVSGLTHTVQHVLSNNTKFCNRWGLNEFINSSVFSPDKPQCNYNTILMNQTMCLIILCSSVIVVCLTHHISW